MVHDSMTDAPRRSAGQGYEIPQPLAHLMAALEDFDVLGVRYYVRYMDDMVAVVEDKESAKALLDKTNGLLASMKLRINPKSGIYPVSRGVDFCGYRIRDTHIRPRKRCLRAWKQRFARLRAKYARGVVSLKQCQQRVASFLAVMRHADALKSSDSILKRFVLEAKNANC
jgi:hypothetical protein